MDCLIHLAALCLFSPENVYIDASVDYAINTDNRFLVARDGGWRMDRFANTRDHARIAIGWTIPATRELTFNIAFVHASIPSVYDRGYEAISLGAVWRPFGGGR